MKLLITCIILLAVSSPALALDRVQLIQSRIRASISSILAPSDYLVIVNRVDSLDDAGASQIVDGAVRPLPGLSLGVDAKGEPVVSGQTGTSYNGPVAVQLVIDNQVRKETFQTLQKMLPEIMGGLRDDDELKVSQAPLRQPPVAVPQANPQMARDMSERQNPMQDNLKFLALLLITGGLFFWFLSRINFPKHAKDHPKMATHQDSPQLDDDAKKSAEVTPADFEVLDPEAVGLFLLKEVTEKRELIWYKWVKFAPAKHQRDVFGTLPSWILGFLQDIGEQKAFDEKDLAELSLHDLFNEIVLIEKSFKSQSQKHRAFLQWFPAQALRHVPKSAQATLSVETKRTLWALRPDLGNLVRTDGLSVDQVMVEPTASEVERCVHELATLPSTSIERGRDHGQDLVVRWTMIINELTEFSPIESQLQQAEAKLAPADHKRLMTRVAHLRTPLSFEAEHLKEWLRIVDPDDYQWWLNLFKDPEPWSLSEHLRPMRFAMFKQSAENANWKNWSEDQRKDSAARLLTGMRRILDPSWRGQEREIA